MNLDEIQDLYAENAAIKAYKDVLENSSQKSIFLDGLCASATAMVSSVMCKQTPFPFLFILEDVEEASYFYHDLVQIMGDTEVLFYPSSYKRAIKYGQKDAANEILRTEVLNRLQKTGNKLYIVTHPEAIAEKVVDIDTLNSNTLDISVGQSVPMKTVQQRLTELGFTCVEYVYEPGQFAIRGSIIDVYSFASELPYRIDFFGDDIESIRTFEVENQLSIAKTNNVSIIPELKKTMTSEISFFRFLHEKTIIMAHNVASVADCITSIKEEVNSPHVQKIIEEEDENESASKVALIEGDEFLRDICDFRMVNYGISTNGTSQNAIHFECSPQPIYHKNFDLVSASFTAYLEDGYRLYICSDSNKQIERIQAIFDDRNDKIPFMAVNKTIHEGYVDKQLQACFFTDHQIFDRFHKYSLRSDKARNGKVTLTLKELNEFQIGDYVVHTDHGVGRFAGLVRVPEGNTTQEMMKLVYQNDDVVLVSIHALHKVSKYKGKEGDAPKLSHLGTGAWERMKDRTKTRIKDIARDLIKLYAQRREEKGFSFSVDSYMQKELEASFIYEDTPDQLKATIDVKHDMERPMPMDRLICGDVGFGKTEIAIRAAFKAVTDDKQVAVLVPTTVLALQHYKTFSERLKGFPCRVDYISRARTVKEKNAIIKDLNDGKIDIVIGTHSLIGKKIKFKDLGLLIIDEEQKFGVSTKEKLRKLKVNVDTLTMTATPIPRTLQFSLMGSRDLSVISTPPPNRFPVQTELHTFNRDIIADAINFELNRNGQVFIVNNRIQNINEIAALVHDIVPDARICIGHGRIDPIKLEKTILDFINYDYDILIATSIIESGIDISNVNTIIINDAQRFGLSDLHQLRGRVGRSNRKAFCYLLAPPISNLTPEAKRRLEAIENFSELGSGIHIAMQDLDIRGAGNMLGAEQSGFIADLGYETYQKILEQAVHELKTDEFAQLYADEAKSNNKTLSGDDFVDECNIESDLEMLFPDSYVPSSSERMLLYRELDGLSTDEEVAEYRTRLEDRFGKMPHEGEELLKVVKLRHLGRKTGIERILLKNGMMTLYFVSNPDSPYYQSEAFGNVIKYLQNHARNCKIRENCAKRSMLIKNITEVEQAVEVLDEMQSYDKVKKEKIRAV